MLVYQGEAHRFAWFGRWSRKSGWYFGGHAAFDRFFGHVHDDGAAHDGNGKPGQTGLKGGVEGKCLIHTYTSPEAFIWS